MPEMSACQAGFPATLSFFFLYPFCNFQASFEGDHTTAQCSNVTVRGRHKKMKHLCLCDKAKVAKTILSSFVRFDLGLGLTQSFLEDARRGEDDDLAIYVKAPEILVTKDPIFGLTLGPSDRAMIASKGRIWT